MRIDPSMLHPLAQRLKAILAGNLNASVAQAAGYAADAFATTPVGYDVFYRRQMLDYILRTNPPALELDFLRQKYRVNQQDKAWADLFTFTGAGGGTRVNPLGAVEAAVSGSPRFDFDPITRAAHGLLIEESRTNFMNQSDDISSYQRTGATTSGTSTFIEDTSGATHSLNRSFTTPSAGAYCLSVKIKRAVGNTRHIRLEIGQANGARANFNADTGAFISSAAYGTATFLGAGSEGPDKDGFIRFWVAVNFAGAETIAVYVPRLCATENGSITYTGDGASAFFVKNVQLEAGAAPSSYITTTSAAVTRAADSCKIDSTRFADWYRHDEGTFVVLGKSNGVGVGGGACGLMVTDGGSTNIITVHQYMSGNVLRHYFASVASVQQASIQSSLAPGNRTAVASAYKLNDMAGSLNAAVPGADTSGTVPGAMTVMSIGSSAASGAYSQAFNGHIERVMYWPRRLDNATLQILSTL